MKKFFASAVLAFALFAAPAYFAKDVPQQTVTVRASTETEDEAAAALKELSTFATANNVFGAYRNGATTGTYDVALFELDKDGNVVAGEPKWAVYGAATLTEGVKQIESDFATYPDGHNVPSVSAPKANAPKANV